MVILVSLHEIADVEEKPSLESFFDIKQTHFVSFEYGGICFQSCEERMVNMDESEMETEINLQKVLDIVLM